MTVILLFENGRQKRPYTLLHAKLLYNNFTKFYNTLVGDFS